MTDSINGIPNNANLADIMSNLHQIADERDALLKEVEVLRAAMMVERVCTDPQKLADLVEAWFRGYLLGTVVTTGIAAIVFWFSR